MLAIVGASGKLGGATLAALLSYKLAAPSEIVAITSSQPRSETWKSLESKGVTVRHGTFEDGATLEAALQGCDKFFLVSTPKVELDYNDAPEGQGREKHHYVAIQAALRAGVGHIYYSSLAFGRPSKAGVMRAHIRTETYLESLGAENKVAVTVMREGLYSESWPLYLMGVDPKSLTALGIDHEGNEEGGSGEVEVRVPGDGKVSWTAIEDLGLASALVLGCYVVIAPAYASEVCPLALRAHLTSYTNLCFVIGQLLANGVTAGTSKLDNHWAYSIPFALQWFWVLVILPGMFFVPESPWWLVRMGRMHEAEEALRRLSSSKVNVSATLAVIAETDRLEREIEAGSTYLDCFNKANWRRTEISIGVYCTQVLSGIYLINYGTYFFQQAGLATEDSFYMSIGFLAVGFVGTLGSWFLMLHFGRRPIFVQGLGMLVILQLIIGILDCVPGRPSGVAWAESTLMLVWNFAYDLSIGPVCFALLGECSAARVRSKTIAVATAAQGVIGIIMTVAIPYMINPDQANMQGKLGFFFGGLAALCYVWAFFRVPETRGRSYDELDMLFSKNIPARKFKDYQVDGVAHTEN
ncbi:hypothetical protein G7054_g13700 [Neopestalotiopsis clavispora]|nr:hypothetical protein G7054_g13700 [Neopestalotiopsis clavispora]